MYIYAYRRIMRTPRNMKLFYHKDQQSQWQTHKINVVSQIYERIEQDFHKSYDMADLQMKAYIDMGARSLQAGRTDHPGEHPQRVPVCGRPRAGGGLYLPVRRSTQKTA